MRRKAEYKFLILFSLVLFLSVGYAVVNSVSLTITGSAAAGSETLEVYFTGVTETSNYNKATASATAKSTSATGSISNMTLNETITLKYVISNNETDVDAKLIVYVPASNDYFQISASEGTITDGAGHVSPRLNTMIESYDVTYLSDSDGGYVTDVPPPGNYTAVNYTIEAGDTFVLMLTIKMIKTPITSADSEFDFDVPITARPISSTV